MQCSHETNSENATPMCEVVVGVPNRDNLHDDLSVSSFVGSDCDHLLLPLAGRSFASSTSSANVTSGDGAPSSYEPDASMAPGDWQADQSSWRVQSASPPGWSVSDARLDTLRVLASSLTSMSDPQALITSHGLHVTDSDSAHVFTAMVQHVFSGACVGGLCSMYSGVWSTVSEYLSDLFDFLCGRDGYMLPLSFLADVCRVFGISCEHTTDDDRGRSRLLALLREVVLAGRVHSAIEDLFKGFERLSRTQLETVARAHGIVHVSGVVVEELKRLITKHITCGECDSSTDSVWGGCSGVQAQFQAETETSIEDIQIYVLSRIVGKVRGNALKRVLQVNDVHYELDDSVSAMRRKLKAYIRGLRRGKQSRRRAEQCREQRARRREEEAEHLKSVRDRWPQLVSKATKERLVAAFREKTSRDALRTFTCACCAQLTLQREQRVYLAEDLPVELLTPPDDWSLPLKGTVDSQGRYTRAADRVEVCEPAPKSVPLPCADEDERFRNVMLEPAGIVVEEADHGSKKILVCKACSAQLRRGKLPALALANRTYLGKVPPELDCLTHVEESMIALCRAKCWILQLKETDSSSPLPGVQRSVKGHIIIHPQHPENIETILPRTMEDTCTPICVIFVGSKQPTREWLRDKATPLCVRREKVREALIWLKQHNPLYKDVVVDNGRINDLPEYDMVPIEPYCIDPSDGQDTLSSRYDVGQRGPVDISHESDGSTVHSPVIDSLIVTDVDGNAPSKELKAAAMRHFRRGGSHFDIPHDEIAANEFFNPVLFPKVYPTLFPYGIGGFEDVRRSVGLSMKRHVRYLLSLADTRFQKHYSFLFTAFNILQRRSILLHTSLKVRKASFRRVADELSSISPEAMASVCQKLEAGNTASYTAEEKKIFKLMDEVKFVSTQIPGSSAARLNMRNEIRAMMLELGLPSFYITINPADVYNPLVKLLAGEDININRLLPEQVPNPAEQNILLAKNPALAARFFNCMMKAFIKTVLGYNNRCVQEGVLGVVKGYYGCVEAQGRGSLHCHMIVWVEGALNPSEIRRRVVEGDDDFGRRLLDFLDDTIKNEIPQIPARADLASSLWKAGKPPHPCAVRDVVGDHNRSRLSADLQEVARAYDFARLVEKCQRHLHSHTCYKYCKPGQPRKCRFDLSADHVRASSAFDAVTGELLLRCVDGLVNNYNETMIEALRCNIDIQFIGSGEAAKGVLYYITDYIAKPQLKTHVAYAGVELALRKLAEFNRDVSDAVLRAKRMLQRCTFSTIANQELSAQQVMSYNLELEDHFTSHEFRQLYWPSAERFVNSKDPSPECYPLAGRVSTTRTVEGHEDVHMDVDGQDTGGDHADSQGQESESDGKGVFTSRPDDPMQVHDDMSITYNTSARCVTACANQLEDYMYRPVELEDLTYWDFVAQTEKVSASAAQRDPDAETEDDEEDDEDIVPTTLNVTVEHVGAENAIAKLLQQTTRERPVFPFLREHCETGKKVMKIVHPRLRQVVVPIGPALPRRDRVQEHARYSRLMLLLFRPWRTVDGLREHTQPWETVFDRWVSSATPYARAVMDNMQLLHECRDQRDNHIKAGDHRRWIGHDDESLASSTTGMARTTADQSLQSNDDIDLLAHMRSLEAIRTQRQCRVDLDTQECLDVVERYDLFHAQSSPSTIGTPANDDIRLSFLEEVTPGGPTATYEDQWKMAYEDRRARWRADQSTPVVPSPDSVSRTALQAQISTSNGQDEERTPSSSHVRQDLPSTQPWVVEGERNWRYGAVIEDVITEWTLNCEQSRAFRLIAEHSLTDGRHEPLRMFINGPGGTGKSRVINALRDFFRRTMQARRFRLASFTGVAARNIDGATLHSMLPLDQRKKPSSSSIQELAAMWAGVDYLFIDEVSMISCRLLAEISAALNMVKRKEDKPDFGGINVIFAGDFAQLPPVTGSRLYAKVDSGASRMAASTSGQATVAGRLLWETIKTVVTLTEIMRQNGPENERFVQLLARLREGRCTSEDYLLLNTRLVQNQTRGTLDFLNNSGPVLVTNNAAKDAINSRAVEAYARTMGQAWHWYHSTDRHRGSLITDLALRNMLDQQDSGQCTQRLSRIPLAIGMKVIICQNFDVAGGIVNGSIGYLRRIRYRVDSEGHRHLTSCIVHLPDLPTDSLPHLADREVAVLPDDSDLQFRNPYSGATMSIKRTQVPILPAYAMTVHKAQGQTFSKVCLDLQSCRGSEQPYVMLSRATSLSAVTILRPFDFKKITCNRNEDLRSEMDVRLPILTQQTIIDTGTQHEAELAQLRLAPLLNRFRREDTYQVRGTKRKRPHTDDPVGRQFSTRTVTR